MNLVEKTQALQALDSHFFVSLNAHNWWYASLPHTEVGGTGILSSCMATGETPDIAIDNLWNELTRDLAQDKYLVQNATCAVTRLQYRWSAPMWEIQKRKKS